jgi:uncharacterized YigZ family protein
MRNNLLKTCYNNYGDKMKQVKEHVVVEIEIRKSKFIANLIPVRSVTDAENELALIKKKHYDATHNCYAYVVNEQNNQKMSDDGEPSRTAGFPILDTLLNNNLDNVLCVVTRYFGGIKLGKGGLIRAYKNATLEAIKKASFYKEEAKQVYETIVPYTIYDTFSHFIKDKAIVLKEDFAVNVTIEFYLLDIEISELENQFNGQLEFAKKEIIKAQTPLE